MTPLLLMAAFQAAPLAEPSPAEMLKAYRSDWSPDRSACAQSPAEVELPATADKAREAMWSRRAELPSYCLMEAASLWAGDDNARAAELWTRGRVRYRYDKIRCVDPKGRNAFDDFHWSLTVNFSQIVQVGRALGAPPETNDALLARLAADPDMFPKTPPDEQVCEGPSGGIAPAAQWRVPLEKLRADMATPPKP